MGLKNSGSNTTACINRHIGTAYDKVAIVADNIDEVKALGIVLERSFKYLGASDTPPSVRLDGSVIQNGDYYFDSVNDALVYYDLASNGWFVVDPNQVTEAMNATAVSETNAKASELLARTSASTTVTKATEAGTSAGIATAKAVESANSAIAAQSVVNTVQDALGSVQDFIDGKTPIILGNQSKTTVLMNNFNPPASVFGGKLVAGTASGAKILFFGDSTMWGSKPAPLTTEQQLTNPPAMFKIGLDILFPSNGVSVINKAIAGSNLYSMLRGINHNHPKTYAEVLAAETPVVAFCGHCLNDASSADGMTNIHQYYLDLIEWVDVTRAYGTIPILVTPVIHALLGDGTAAQTKRMGSFIQAMRDVAEKKNVDLVDSNKYAQKSLSLFRPVDIAPDGVHLSVMFSSQHGFNMLIPLVRPHLLSKHGDIAGLSNTMWQDNLPSVFNKVTYGKSSRFGPTLLGDGATSDLKINFPVIIDSATSDTFLGFGGASWDNHGVSQITYFDGYGTINTIEGNIDASTSVPSSDAMFAPTYCRLPAGLAIIGVKLPANTPTKKVFTFAGLQMLDKNFSGSGHKGGAGAVQRRSILAGDVIQANVTLTSGDTLLKLNNDDGDRASTVIEIVWDAVENKVLIKHPNGSVVLWDAPVANSVFGLRVVIEQKSFIVTIGGLQQIISGLTYSLPKLIVSNPVIYNVTRP